MHCVVGNDIYNATALQLLQEICLLNTSKVQNIHTNATETEIWKCHRIVRLKRRQQFLEMIINHAIKITVSS